MVNFDTEFTLRYRNLKENDQKNTHALHIEDSIIKGKDYIDRMTSFFYDTVDILQGNGDSSKPMPSQKIDGAPAVFMATFFPRFSEKPFVATKGLFAATPKFYTSNEDLDKNVNLPDGLKIKLKAALQLAKQNIIPSNQLWQGDMLFTKGDVNKTNDEGVDSIWFKPNTLAYMIPENSEMAQKIMKSTIGVAFHTRYKDNNGTLSHTNDIKISECQNIPEWAFIIDAQLPGLPNGINFSHNEAMEINDMIKQLDEMCNNLVQHKEYENFVNNEQFLQFYFMTLQNHKYDKEEEISAETIIEELHNWIKTKMRKEYVGLENLKTYKGRNKRRDTINITSKELHDIVRNNEDLITKIAEAISLATEIKLELIKRLNRANNWLVKIETSKGFENTSGEGFVVSNINGDMVKLVDRSAFSHFNRSPDVIKGWESDKRTQLGENMRSFNEIYKLREYFDNEENEICDECNLPIDQCECDEEINEQEQEIEINTSLPKEEIEKVCQKVFSNNNIIQEAFEEIYTSDIESKLKYIKQKNKDITWYWVEKINQISKIHYSTAKDKPKDNRDKWQPVIRRNNEDKVKQNIKNENQSETGDKEEDIKQYFSLLSKLNLNQNLNVSINKEYENYIKPLNGKNFTLSDALGRIDLNNPSGQHQYFKYITAKRKEGDILVIEYFLISKTLDPNHEVLKELNKLGSPKTTAKGKSLNSEPIYTYDINGESYKFRYSAEPFFKAGGEKNCGEFFENLLAIKMAEITNSKLIIQKKSGESSYEGKELNKYSNEYLPNALKFLSAKKFLSKEDIENNNLSNIFIKKLNEHCINNIIEIKNGTNIKNIIQCGANETKRGINWDGNDILPATEKLEGNKSLQEGISDIIIELNNPKNHKIYTSVKSGSSINFAGFGMGSKEQLAEENIKNNNITITNPGKFLRRFFKNNKIKIKSKDVDLATFLFRIYGGYSTKEICGEEVKDLKNYILKILQCDKDYVKNFLQTSIGNGPEFYVIHYYDGFKTTKLSLDELQKYCLEYFNEKSFISISCSFGKCEIKINCNEDGSQQCPSNSPLGKISFEMLSASSRLGIKSSKNKIKNSNGLYTFDQIYRKLNG